MGEWVRHVSINMPKCVRVISPFKETTFITQLEIKHKHLAKETKYISQHKSK